MAVNIRRSIELKIKKLSPDAVLPTYAHDGDVGMDVTVISVEYDPIKDEYIYGTGLACETLGVVSMFCHPRSSIHKTNYFLTNSVGIVDCKTYRGEIKAIFKHRDSLETRITNTALEMYDKLPWYKKLRIGELSRIKEQIRKDFMMNPLEWAPYQVGDKAFQIWLAPIKPIELVEVDELSETTRGKGGFGSTNKPKEQ